MNYSWSVPIDKLMIWRANNWAKYESKPSKLILRVHCNQLLITTDINVLESLNMHSKIKGIYKDDIMILIVSSTGHEIRKLKFQITSHLANCLQKLGEHFPIVNHNCVKAKNIIPSKYRNVNELLKNALESKDSITSLPLSPAYKDFVKLCLLDPTFPQVIKETEIILQDISNKEIGHDP